VESGVLQIRIVLVRPELVDLVVRDGPAEHVARRSRALPPSSRRVMAAVAPARLAPTITYALGITPRSVTHHPRPGRDTP
jgi:hypothetical protein